MSFSFSVGRLSCRQLRATVVLVGGGNVSVVFGFGKDGVERRDGEVGAD